MIDTSLRTLSIQTPKMSSLFLDERVDLFATREMSLIAKEKEINEPIDLKIIIPSSRIYRDNRRELLQQIEIILSRDRQRSAHASMIFHIIIEIIITVCIYRSCPR